MTRRRLNGILTAGAEVSSAGAGVSSTCGVTSTGACSTGASSSIYFAISIFLLKQNMLERFQTDHRQSLTSLSLDRFRLLDLS